MENSPKDDIELFSDLIDDALTTIIKQNNFDPKTIGCALSVMSVRILKAIGCPENGAAYIMMKSISRVYNAGDPDDIYQ